VPRDRTLCEIALEFGSYPRGRYVHPDGQPTGEADNFAVALSPLSQLYGRTEAARFGPNALQAVRLAMLRADLSRRVVNARINRIRRFFKWAVSRQLVPGAVCTDLQTLEPLNRGEHVELDGQDLVVRKSPGVQVLGWSVVTATLPYLPRPVAAMVQIQRCSNCRVADVCLMRGCDLTLKADVWEHRPEAPKNTWREEQPERHKRVVLVGRR
jgi:hypothetical protein